MTCKATWETVVEIRRLYVNGALQKDLVLQFGLAPCTIQSICTNHSWFDPGYHAPRPRTVKLDPASRAKIVREYLKGVPVSTLRRKHNISKNYVRRLALREYPELASHSISD